MNDRLKKGLVALIGVFIILISSIIDIESPIIRFAVFLLGLAFVVYALLTSRGGKSGGRSQQRGRGRRGDYDDFDDFDDFGPAQARGSRGRRY